MIRDFDKRDIKATLAFVCTLHNDLVTKDSQCFFTAVAGLREVKILLSYFISCFFSAIQDSSISDILIYIEIATVHHV